MSDKGRKIYNGITNIDDDIIMAALAAKPQAHATKKKKSAWVYVFSIAGSAAAILALVVVGILIVPNMSKTTETSMGVNSVASNSPMAETADAVCAEDASTSSYKDQDAYEADFSDSNDWASETTNDEKDESASYTTVAPEDLEENQIYLMVDVDKVENVTISYPGYDTLVVEDSIAEQIIELINNLGVLTVKEDYLDVTTEDYATIVVYMIDGSEIEITPKYPYIFINGEVYECEHKSRAIYNLAVYISDFCSSYFLEEE